MPSKGGDFVQREDIRLKSREEKERVYLKVDTLHQLGIEVSIKEHESGFPAVTVDCGDVHIITDILSIEEWSVKMKQLK